MENKRYINKIEIIVDGENDFDDKCEYFIKTLIEKYDLFNTQLNEEKDKWNKAKIDKNKCFIEPENIKYKSPITIFDGEWGVGKTRFFENLILKTFDKGSNLFEKFSKIGIIDLWEFSSSKDIACDILEKFYKIFFPELIEISKGKRFLSFLLKFGFKTLSQWPLLILDKLTNKLINSEKKIEEFNKFIDNLFEKQRIKKLNNQINKTEPIIIVFENLERLEVQAYEIVKLIQRISMIPNLMIIISVNKTKLFSHHKLEKDEEHWIDKYSTLGNEYSFKQTYTNFLLNNEINIQDSLIINEMLIKNENLNIRYLNNKFNNDLNLSISNIDYWFKKSKYHGLI
ncbi:MAG: KAP family NTPase, partial [Ureaplasma sp.]|nr:KAP family NTPase [Ureaplasma sp.]